jgi:hypothetical protein
VWEPLPPEEGTTASEAAEEGTPSEAKEPEAADEPESDADEVEDESDADEVAEKTEEAPEQKAAKVAARFRNVPDAWKKDSHHAQLYVALERYTAMRDSLPGSWRGGAEPSEGVLPAVPGDLARMTPSRIMNDDPLWEQLAAAATNLPAQMIAEEGAPSEAKEPVTDAQKQAIRNEIAYLFELRDAIRRNDMLSGKTSSFAALGAPTSSFAALGAPTTSTASPAAAADAATADTYMVEAIVDKGGVGRGVRYLVKWAGYPSSANTWEPRAMLLKDVPLLVQQFDAAWLERQAAKRKGPAARKKRAEGN